MSGWSPSTTAAAGARRRAQRDRPADVRAAGRVLRLPRIRSTGLDDEEFAERLLIEEHVAVVPGRRFGPSGEGHVRVCYATAYEQLEEALERIGRFVERVRAEG